MYFSKNHLLSRQRENTLNFVASDERMLIKINHLCILGKGRMDV